MFEVDNITIVIYTMNINHFKYCKISNCYIFQKFNK